MTDAMEHAWECYFFNSETALRQWMCSRCRLEVTTNSSRPPPRTGFCKPPDPAFPPLRLVKKTYGG